MGAKNGLIKKIMLCVVAVIILAAVLTSCKIEDPITEAEYFINDNQVNYYNQDHTTTQQAVDEFTDSITALRKYLNGESFVDSGYFMGVDYDIDILDTNLRTVGNFALRVNAYLYTFPYEDEDGNPTYYYYENGQYVEANNPDGTRTLISGLEIHNEAIKKSDISIEWYNGATNEVLIGMYYDGLNGNVDDPGNIMYLNVQGYKRSFPEFGDTVLYQQLIRLLVNMSVEGLLEALGLQGDAGTGKINNYMVTLVQSNYKRVVNDDIISLLFYNISSASDLVAKNLTKLLGNIFGVFERKWDPMTAKFLGFKFSTVANAIINSATLDMQAIISPDKQGVTNVLTDAVFAARGGLTSYDVNYTYTAGIRFDYGWSYPEYLKLDKDFYQEFDYGQYDFEGMLYVPSWDAQFDASIKTKMQQYDNSTNNVFMEFRDIANGELMIGVYYRDERAYLDISGLSYMYGWIDLESLGFPQVYDERLDLAEVLWKFHRMINKVIVSIVDSILDPSKNDKENSVLQDIMNKTDFTEKTEADIFSINSETLTIDHIIIKQMLEETGAGTYSTRQLINIIDSVLPYTLDQLAIMLGIASAEIMVEKTYFTLTWDVDKQEFVICMYTNVGIPLGEPSNMIFRLELTPVYFGDRRVTISQLDFSRFKPLRQIYTYSGTLDGDFVFSANETVELSKLLSATIGESSGLNTPYQLPASTGLSFQLIYDQFVTDQVVDGRLKKAGRSAFHLQTWLTDREEYYIIELSSDDVCFDNEVYKDLPAREAELGYIWVNIVCVTKNGEQVIPKVKIREDVFMASMSAYMHKQTKIEDNVSSFADNDFNLSLTSIISALCKDAYVIPAATKLEITSSNETLQNLFRVNGLIGNIKVNAGFDYRVRGLESVRNQYYMYEVGNFDNITGDSPYYTKLHKTVPVCFYEDYMDDYDPLQYDFLVYDNEVVLDDGSRIQPGTIYLFELDGKRTIQRQDMSASYAASSFFLNESPENQDISKVKFLYEDLILNPEEFELASDGSKIYANDNRLVYEIEGSYYYRTYYGKQRRIPNEYVDTSSKDGTVYILWQGITEVVFYESGTSYYFFDRNKAVEGEDYTQAHLSIKTYRNLLFEYDEDSIKITEACKTQYAPRTNGSFMGEVRRYFVVFESSDAGKLGVVETLYHDDNSIYPRYYNDEDENFVLETYDEDGVLIDSQPMPITLYVMEPCEPLKTDVEVYVKTNNGMSQFMTFPAQFIIDWELASADKRGFMVVSEVIVAPEMMGECTFPVRIIVLNREISAHEDNYVPIYEDESDVPTTSVPVVDEIDLDPYEYIIAKYAYLSDINKFNPTFLYEQILEGYLKAVDKFIAAYFAQEEFAFNIKFNWQKSYLNINKVGDLYVQKEYNNLVDGELTAYEWSFDRYELGNNLETSVSPLGGTVYLHTKFHGQTVALKVNIRKRTFSHVKFFEEDDFDPAKYNADNMEGDPYIVGSYKANYYDPDTYQINDEPIFVFTDEAGGRYSYQFNMPVIVGLLRNSEGALTSAYEKQEKYGIIWGDPTITNITGKGSYYNEYAYSYVYKEDSFTEIEQRYNSLSDEKKEEKVKVLHTDGTVDYMYFYVRMGEGENARAGIRNRWKYSEITAFMSEAQLTGEAFEVDYSRNSEPKFKAERTGYALVRDTDVENDTVAMNRPYYYFYKNASEDKAPVLLTESEYYRYIDNDLEMRDKYGLNTDNADTITTAGLDVYHMFRLYYLYNGSTYAISTLSNKIIEPKDLNSQSMDETDFKFVELRIAVECPELDLIIQGRETDAITGEEFDYHKLNAGDPKELGFYKVDPLKEETLYLPDAITIYFNFNGGTQESFHTFKGLEWDDTHPLVTIVHSDDVKRYKIDVDLNELEDEMIFNVKVKIGNAISGYREVSVAVKILSKNPTGIEFYSGETLLATPITKTEFALKDSTEKYEYYSYYVNTFVDFKLPDSLVATFTDGHTETFANIEWSVAANSEANLVFAPDTIVVLMTKIGTNGGVSLDIYLAVVVENYSLKSMSVENEFGDYYVKLKSENGMFMEGMLQVKSLFQINGDETGYYYPGASTYYIHISTGAEDEKDTPIGQIGLYTRNELTGAYVWKQAVTVYDFICAVYSRASLTLEKDPMDMDKQAIVYEKDSIFNHKILLTNEIAGDREMRISGACEITFKDSSETISVNISYTDQAAFVYTVKLDDFEGDGVMKVKITSNSGHIRYMRYEELLVYITAEYLSTNYIDNKNGQGDVVGWQVISVDGFTEDLAGTPFSRQTLLSSYVLYNTQTKEVRFAEELGLSGSGVIVIRNNYDNETVTMSGNELLYRLTHYYRDLRVVEFVDESGNKKKETRTINNKSIAINDLYKIMDINDMIEAASDPLNPVSDDKYTISLGTGKGSYDVKVRLKFTDGIYLANDSRGTVTVNVEVYNNNGDAKYSGGYVLANEINATVIAVINDGSGNRKNVNYNRAATDEKLTTWYVEPADENTINPLNIYKKVNGESVPVKSGELLEVITAESIYTTVLDREITISTLTSEGFRLKRVIKFETLVDSISGDINANAIKITQNESTFAIKDGLITVENIYEYANPRVEYFFGKPDYLPTSVSVMVNERKINVSDVSWKIDEAWKEVLSTLKYTGTGGEYLMATAEILGCEDKSKTGGARFGTTKINVYVNVESAEIIMLPWEDEKLGNGLATETIADEFGKNEYIVYVDAYSDSDAVENGAIKTDENGKTYLEMPRELLVKYAGGKFFTFSSPNYYYSGTYEVTRIYFNDNGIDITQMVSSKGDLFGARVSDLNERFLDLSVDLGLGQVLNIRFYFHNKRVKRDDYIVYYTDYYENEERVRYADLSQEAVEEKVGSSDKRMFVEYEENGVVYARVANLMYYYSDYYKDGELAYYSLLTAEERSELLDGIEGIPLYKENGQYALKATLVYSDIIPVFSLADEDVRADIAEEKKVDWNKYLRELMETTNNIRIEKNMEDIIAQAQDLRSGIKTRLDNLNFVVASEISPENKEAEIIRVMDILLDWTSDVTPVYNGLNEDEFPTKTIFTDAQSRAFAGLRLVKTGEALARSYAEGIVSATGSRAAKERARKERIQEFYTELIEKAYTQMISDYMEREFVQLLVPEISGMTNEDYNDLIYYKNLVEAYFDADRVIEAVYKLRSLRNNNVSADFAAVQIEKYISDAVEKGYGFSVEYTDYKINGIQVASESLTEEEKAEKVYFGGYFGKGNTKQVNLFDVSTANAKILTKVYDYDKLAEAVIVQALYDAYAKAYAKAYKGTTAGYVELTVDTPVAEDATKQGAPLHDIAYTVNNILENRLNLCRLILEGYTDFADMNESYTIRYFVDNIAYGTGDLISKKTMRAYLVNLINEAMDFTVLEGSAENDDMWKEFTAGTAEKEGLYKKIIKNSFLSIDNYSSSINTMRRSLISGSSISGTLSRILEISTNNFINTVYAEAEYVGTIKGLQEKNGQIIGSDRCYEYGSFSLEKFGNALNENASKYLIEPYYLYRGMPDKILIYFDDQYVLNPGKTTEQTITDRQEDVSGKPYMTTIVWSKGIDEAITFRGAKGTLEGDVTSVITGKTQTVDLAAIASNRVVDNPRATIEYIEDGIAYGDDIDNSGRKTSDNRYYMIKRQIAVADVTTYAAIGGMITVTTYYVYFYKYDATFEDNADTYYASGVLKYSLAYKKAYVYSAVITDKTDYVQKVSIFAGYDSEKVVVYEFESEYSSLDERNIVKQHLYVYNPFEFSQQKDMPDKVIINGEYMKIKWDSAGIDPRGNITTTGEQTLSGRVVNENGQEISIALSVAKWSYAGFFRLTDSDGENGVVVDVNGEDKRFVSMNPLYFYFSEYSVYSAQDYYLLFFTVRIYMNGGVKRIVFEKPAMDAPFTGVAEKEESEGGFVGKIFYPEDSKCVQYGTDDETMGLVNRRKRYLIYWDGTEKTRVISNRLSRQGNCDIFIGNDEVSKYTLETLRDSGDTVPPIKAFYCCERMYVSEITLMKPEANDSAESEALFAEVENILKAQSGQAPIVISPDGYLPTGGDITLTEINVHYDTESIKVRYLWNGTLSSVTNNLVNFIKYAYPDVEEKSRRQYAMNLIMSWNYISAAEKAEIISYAQSYMRELNADLGENYTTTQCDIDAYALLAINERYRYSGTDANKLYGGGNNNVLVNVLVMIDGTTAIYESSVRVRAIFMDYTPLTYYEYDTQSNGYVAFANIGSVNTLTQKSTVYIAIRKDYWDAAESVEAYETDGMNMISPYDNIGDDMYKLLQIAANRNAYDSNGNERVEIGGAYIIRLDKVSWTYNEDENAIVSSAFEINGIAYQSQLLKIGVVIQ